MNMSIHTHKHFNFNYKHFLIDEIALDGLEGIGIELLWRRMENRIGSQITPKMKVKYFKFIAECESVLLYQLNEPPPHVEIVDRFTMIDETTGHLLDPPDYLDGPYEYHVVSNEYGSCPNYDTRLLIPKNAVQMMSYEEVMSQFGEKLVLVASLEERWQALAPHLPITYLNQLSPTHYCILELIGKSRENGQMTIGKTNLNKIVKEPKLLFYNRNTLQKLDLIKNQYATQVTSGKAMKSIILRLKRYHLSKLETLPKIGRIHDMVQYLLKQPDRSEQNEILIKKGYMTSRQSKRLQKGINIFRFEEREIKLEKSITKTEKQKLVVKKKFVSLTSQSDESSQSEDETEEPIKCQYKVGVNLMRQAYEMLLDAGIRGLTQVEVAQLLGIEFYTSRTICRILKGKKIVREFMEDKGRQRTARYIAIAATKEKDKEYANEKNKLLEYVNKKGSNYLGPNTAIDNDTDYEVPLKKIKLENEASEKDNMIDNDEDTVITEIKVLDGFENVKETLLNSKKSPTLRQLKFANGILKVVNTLKYVIGFQTLSTLVSKEINEPAMDTKALKLFVQKLVTDEQLKILRLKRPKNYNKYTFFICAPNIKATDAIIINKYKEIFARSQLNKKSKKTVTTDVTRPQAHFVYPRYMKIQKLHEFIMQLIYFNVNDSDPSYPVGFGSLFYIIPEMTIEFALGNITNIDTDVAQLKLNDSMYGTKIRDAPDYLGRILLQSKSLHNSVRVGLRVLAVLGLVQLINQPSTIMTKDGGLVTYVFYVNRHAKILDTGGKWPREEVDLKTIEKSYYFESMNDVGKYWNDVHTISLNTTVNLPKRERYRLVHPMRDENCVAEYDTGVRYGDGYGPCGFDSSMFMDIPRLWRTFLQRTNNTQTVAVKSKVKPKKRMKKTKPIKHDIIKVKKKKIIKEKENGENKVVKPPRIRKKPSDYQVQWSEFEDKIIMMCKVAIMIMSPVSQPGCLKIRNTVAKDLLTMFDPKKTASNCHKRAVTQELNSIFLHEKVCILNELRRRKDAIKKYEGLLKLLRIRHHANITRFVNEARLPMLELIWIINQIEKNKSYVQRIPCIAMNLDAFNLSYTITPSSTNRPYNTYKTPTSEPELAVLKEAIILTTMLSLKSPITSETAKKIYSLYKAYDEPTLRSAIEHLRKSGAIAARDKIINNHFNSANFEYIVQSSYKIASVYRRKWVQRLDGEFGENLEELLSTDIPKNGLKGCSELNCLLCEMCCSDVLEIMSDTIPVVSGSGGSILQEEQMNVIDMENRFKLKSGLIGWKSKSNVEKFSSVYENFCSENILATLVKNAVVKSFTNEDLDMKNEVILYLENKGEKGCTYQELQNSVSLDRQALCNMLKDLEDKSIIKRVGVYENRILLTKFAKPYFISIKPDLNIIPTPWLNLDTEIQLDIFLKWASVIMNKVFETPGCSVTYLSNHYEFISIRSVQDICVFLENSKCVTLQCIEKKEIDLFSEDDGVVELNEFNPFDSPDSMLVFPVKNSITKFVHVKKCMINTLEGTD